MRKRENDKKKTMQTLVLISQIGLVMIAAIGLGTACGVWLDRKLGTSFLTVVFLLPSVVNNNLVLITWLKKEQVLLS